MIPEVAVPTAGRWMGVCPGTSGTGSQIQAVIAQVQVVWAGVQRGEEERHLDWERNN